MTDGESMAERTKLKDVLTSPEAFSWNFALYLPKGFDWTLDTPCAVLDPDDVEEGQDEPRFALDNDLEYTLNMQDFESIVENARAQKFDVNVNDLLKAFLFYIDHDAFIDFSN